MNDIDFKNFCDEFYELFQGALVDVGITASTTHDGNSEYSYSEPIKQIAFDTKSKLNEIGLGTAGHIAKSMAGLIRHQSERPEFFRLTPLGPEPLLSSCTISGNQGALRTTYRDREEETLRIECAFAEAA